MRASRLVVVTGGGSGIGAATAERLRAAGIIVEVPQDPEHALCDGPQALFASDFPAFAEHVAAHAELSGKVLA